jgi:hypothetical protein
MWTDESMMPQEFRVGGARLLDCYKYILERLFVLGTGSAIVPPSAPISGLRKFAQTSACLGAHLCSNGQFHRYKSL